MKKYKVVRAPQSTSTLTRAELETVKRDRDDFRDRAVKLAVQGLESIKREQSTRAELDRERRAHAADLNRLNADVDFYKKALARALEHLDGAVLVTDDAPVDRLSLDETIDGDMLVRLDRR